MGVPGMMLSPVVLNYLRVEMLKIEVLDMPDDGYIIAERETAADPTAHPSKEKVGQHP